MDSSSSDADNSLILEEQSDFVLKLLRELSKDGRSCVVSPFSVAVALSMAYAGAKEKTSQEIGQLLAKNRRKIFTEGASESAVHEYFDELIKSIKKPPRNYTLDVVNKMYVEAGHTVTEEFETIIDRHYGGQFEALNFQKSVESAKKINEFVEQATHDKIHDLISPNMLNDMTRLVLINAVYFKGEWANKFNAHNTKKKTFHIDENNTEELDMMSRSAKLIYFENNELQLLGMPYRGGEMFMFVLLPLERFGLAKMLAKLDGKSLLELIKKRSKLEVQVGLPKFRLESTHDLNEPLTKLGMSTAFSNSANFEGIAATDEQPLKIDKMVQKAFIEKALEDPPSPQPKSYQLFARHRHLRCIWAAHARASLRAAGDVPQPSLLRRTATHEAGHVLSYWLMEHADPVTDVTIVARGISLGCTNVATRPLYNQVQMFARLVGTVGGAMAEQICHETILLAGDDGVKARKLAHTLAYRLEHLNEPSVPFVSTAQLPINDQIHHRILVLLERAKDRVLVGFSQPLTRQMLEHLAVTLLQQRTMNRQQLIAKGRSGHARKPTQKAQEAEEERKKEARRRRK